MNLSDRCHALLETLEAQHLKRKLAKDVAGTVDLSSNDYLGLSKHPELLQAGLEAAENYGTGSTGSRLLSGNRDCFENLEAQLAEFKRQEAALVFSSGYQANAGVLSTLLSDKLWGEKPLVFTDRLIHASLHHACQLSGLKQIRFTHNNLLNLEESLVKHNAAERPHVIVVESVYGMDGDQVDIQKLAKLASAFSSVVYIDEAHATGVIGPQGRGLAATESAEIAALKQKGHWIAMGTFSKAIGVSGAYLACSTAVKDYLVNKCPAFIYSTAPTPFSIGAVGKAIEIIPGLDQARNRLFTLSNKLRELLADLGYSTGGSTTQIVPILVGEASKALAFQDHLRQQGIIASAIRPPTVPPNQARLRMALNSEISETQFAQLCAVIREARF